MEILENETKNAKNILTPKESDKPNKYPRFKYQNFKIMRKNLNEFNFDGIIKEKGYQPEKIFLLLEKNSLAYAIAMLWELEFISHLQNLKSFKKKMDLNNKISDMIKMSEDKIRKNINSVMNKNSSGSGESLSSSKLEDVKKDLFSLKKDHP